MSSTWSIPNTVPLPGGIPSTHTPHAEGTTTILLPKGNTAFLNPVQQYNRDLSISVIRAWNDLRKEEGLNRWNKRAQEQPDYVQRKREKARKKQERKAKFNGEGEHAEHEHESGAKDASKGDENTKTEETEQPEAGPSRQYRAPPITILEALSATGLRAIRYAKEIPDVKHVLANDISSSACEAMRMNVELNGVAKSSQANGSGINGSHTEEEGAFNASGNGNSESDIGRRPGCTGTVLVNEGDACAFMYSRRSPQNRVDVVDLDPYGTAAPFVDSALGCIADGGLLAVTCTDMAVLAGAQYPEKSFANYGGSSISAEYSHEVALRLVLSSLAQNAARYGRYVTPLLCFSIDFYVRLFVRIDTQPQKVKRLASQIGTVFVCSYCQSHKEQPFGRVVEKADKNGKDIATYKTAQGPPEGGNICEYCGGTLHLGGPLWLGALQDTEFAKRVLKSIEGQEADYKTHARMKGMLTMASEELPNLFYFTPNRMHGIFHASSGPSNLTISALFNAGYKVSRSHAASGSIKTNAPKSFVFDIIREYIKKNPVRIDKIPEGSPARRLLAREQTHTVDLTLNPQAKSYEKENKVVRYQVNPEANWGPGNRAKNVPAKKRKGDEVVGEVEGGKKMKADASIKEEQGVAVVVAEEDAFNA